MLWPGLSLLELLNVLNVRALSRCRRSKRRRGLAAKFLTVGRFSLSLSFSHSGPHRFIDHHGDTRRQIQDTHLNVLRRICYLPRHGEKSVTKSNFRAARVGTADPDAVFDHGPPTLLIDDYPSRSAYDVYGRQNRLSSFATVHEQIRSILVERIALEQEDVRP